MIKYLATFGALVAVLVAIVYAQQEGERSSDLEESQFLFRPVYIRYGYHPHNSYGWKGQQQVSHHSPGWGYGWGSYHLHGGGKGAKKAAKKKAKAKKKAQKKAQKAKKKANKKGGGGGGWGWPGGQGGGGGYGGGGYGGYGGGGGYGGYGGFDE